MTNKQNLNQLQAVLSQIQWSVRPEQFAMVGIDHRERLVVSQLIGHIRDSFFHMVIEPQEITLILTESDWRVLRPAFTRARTQYNYRLITFDDDLPADLVGFLATITTALAQTNVSVLAICSYARDYLLVQEQDLDTALQSIEQTVQQYRSSPTNTPPTP
ncbi:MAG: ACT domain-containing protein [Chloroflexota bacterium]